MSHVAMAPFVTRIALGAAVVFAAGAIITPDTEARLGDCAQPVRDGEVPSVTDCLAILQAAVGIAPCFRECTCAVRGRSYVTVVDAQACLAASGGDASRLACACGSRDPFAQMRLSVDVTLALSPDILPPSLHFFLALASDGTGQLGLVKSENIIRSRIWPIQWRREGADIRIDGGSVELWSQAELGWYPFTLTLDEPLQGSTVSVSATGTMDYAYIQIIYGDNGDTAEIVGEPIVTEADGEPPELRLGTSQWLDAPFVGDTFFVVASEPVESESLEADVRILADGTAMVADVSTPDAVGRFATYAAFRPRDYLPFEVELTVDPGGLRDLAGKEAVWIGDPRTTMSDPGPAAANPGFELLDPYPGYGWSGARIGVRYDPSIPSGVDREARLRSYEADRMLGYFDLPSDAVSLQFSAAVDGGCLENYCLRGVGVQLLTPGARRAAYEPTIEPVPNGSTQSCFSGVYSIPEHLVKIDVTDLAGKRVFVHAYAFWDWPCDSYTFTLDDFRVVSATSHSTTMTTPACSRRRYSRLAGEGAAHGTETAELRDRGISRLER